MKRDRIVGVLPMAGKANRLKNLPFSKELFPFKIKTSDPTQPYFNAIADLLLDKMRLAGVEKFHIVTRKNKWDILNYFGGGKAHNINLCYHIADNESAVPYTIDQAYPFIKDNIIVFGFPDIFFQPDDAFNTLLDHYDNTQNCEMVLGVFPEKDPQKWDTVSFDRDGIVKSVHLKHQQKHKRSGKGWHLAIWGPEFTHYLNNFLKTRIDKKSIRNHELELSFIINEFVKEKHTVKAVEFTEGKCIDIGTPDDLKTALKNYSELI